MSIAPRRPIYLAETPRFSLLVVVPTKLLWVEAPPPPLDFRWVILDSYRSTLSSIWRSPLTSFSFSFISLSARLLTSFFLSLSRLSYSSPSSASSFCFYIARSSMAECSCLKYISSSNSYFLSSILYCQLSRSNSSLVSFN